MAVIGVGIDVVDLERFAESLRRTPGLSERLFTPGEARLGLASLAARFAAKEAFVKAWSGARAGRPPQLPTIDLREIEVVDDGHGRPALRLHGDVARALAQLAEELQIAAPLRTHLSLSHDPPTAAAVVLLSAP